VNATTARVPRVILAEDDPDISTPLLRALLREGYDVRHVVDGPAALAGGLSGTADLLVLDLGLPGMDGLDVCRTLRSRGADLPVLVLTARTSEPDLVLGLDAGADDYVAKPFRLAELLARIRVQLRRSSPEGEVLGAGLITVDTASRRVEVFGVGGDAGLTPKEYELLVLLLRKAGTAVSREVIMREVWRTEWLGATKTLDMHVSTLRRKLGPAGAQITTIRGVGLRLDREA
jgi:DNA-binding response OmpR family regulator